MVELLDPRFRYDIEGLTEEQLTILSAELDPREPMFWKKNIFIPHFKGRLLDVQNNLDGSRNYYYTQREHGTQPVLKLKYILEKASRVTYLHNKTKFIAL